MRCFPLIQIDECVLQDILRGQYQALSMDPNSLSNLDQGQAF